MLSFDSSVCLHNRKYCPVFFRQFLDPVLDLGERLIKSHEISDLFISEQGKRALVSVMREMACKIAA